MEPNAQPQAGALDAQQQKQMQLMVKQALGILLQDDSAEMIVNSAKQGDPKATVVRVVSPIIQRIYESAGEAGAKLDMLVVLSAGLQVVAIVSTLLSKAGVIEEAQLPQFVADVAKAAAEEHNAGLQGGGEQPAPAQPPAGGQPPGGMMAGMPAQGAPA